ncbi:MAG: hypothetical protein H7330_11445 [Hymenobacteraceae bacterium]|nr:hypothetical protein [Hymenobacteraceae bacterium]
MLFLGVWCGVLLLLTTAPVSHAQTIRFAPSQLQPDARLLHSALAQLHPGLYRHIDSVEIARRFAELETQWEKPQTLPAAYRDLSLLLASFHDAHTYANPTNQSKTVRAALFGRATCLPFHFRLIEKRMIVTAAVDSGALPRGTEVTRIDDRSVESILDSLLPAVRADGANDANRLSRLEIRGDESVETFDALYSLFFFVGRSFALTAKASDKAAPRSVTVAALPASAREAALARRRTTDVPYWRLEFPDSRTARVTLPGFDTWRDPKFDWKKWLAESFATIRAKRIEALVIDVRRCEGGNDEVVIELLRYLSPKPLTRVPLRRLWRVDHIPNGLLPFLDTWNPALKNLSPADFYATTDGAYERLADRTNRTQLRPYATAFTGKTIYALCGPRNSSAAFQLLHELQAARLATLDGQPTGGNRRGITGGQFFMVRLPNTGLEVDLPLISYAPLRAQPDAGLEPDDLVEPTIEALRAGIDQEMARVRALLREERTER